MDLAGEWDRRVEHLQQEHIEVSSHKEVEIRKQVGLLTRQAEEHKAQAARTERLLLEQEKRIARLEAMLTDVNKVVSVDLMDRELSKMVRWVKERLDKLPPAPDPNAAVVDQWARQQLAELCTLQQEFFRTWANEEETIKRVALDYERLCGF